MNEIDDLYDAILWLRLMLQEGVSAEADYQEYFERHGVVFQTLGFDAWSPFHASSPNRLPVCEELGYQPYPDFICADRKSGKVSIFELKTPFESAVLVIPASRSRVKLRANVESYVSQVHEYAKCVDSSNEARNVVSEALGLTKISAVSSQLVFGLASKNQLEQVSRVLSYHTPAVTIVYFDEILQKLISRYSFGRNDIEKRPGFCLGMALRLHKQLRETAYIVDMGTPSKDRISLMVERSELVFRCVDSAGTIYETRSQYEEGRPFYLRLEYASDNDGIMLSFVVDGHEMEFRRGKRPLNIRPDFSSMTLGSNLRGCECAAFDQLALFWVSEMPGLESRLTFDSYLRSVCLNPEASLQFSGGQWMHSQGATRHLTNSPADGPVSEEN